MQVIALATKEEREYQKARIAYDREPSSVNFTKLRHAYLVMTGEIQCTLKP